MAIRIREINGRVVALCAAKTHAKKGDTYLDDGAHHALSTKFAADMQEMGFLEKDLADPITKRLMLKAEKERPSLSEFYSQPTELEKRLSEER